MEALTPSYPIITVDLNGYENLNGNQTQVIFNWHQVEECCSYAGLAGGEPSITVQLTSGRTQNIVGQRAVLSFNNQVQAFMNTQGATQQAMGAGGRRS
jgi:phosphotransferase system IIB component